MKKFAWVLGIVVLVGFLFFVINSGLNSEDTVQNPHESKAGEDENVLQKKRVEKPLKDKREQTNSSELEFTLTPSNSNYKSFIYQVKNVGDKRITLDFTTGQRYEAVLDKEGEGEVYRYSSGRAFMQVLGEIEIAPNNQEEFTINLPELEPGNYKLTVNLVASDLFEASEQTYQFTILE